MDFTGRPIYWSDDCEDHGRVGCFKERMVISWYHGRDVISDYLRWFLVCQTNGWLVDGCPHLSLLVQFLAQTSWIYCIIGVYFGSIWPALKKLRPSTLSLVHFEELRDLRHRYAIHSLIWHFKISFISYLYLFLLSFPYPKTQNQQDSTLTCRGGSDGGRRRCEGCSKAWGENGQGTCEETPLGLLAA